MRRAGLGRKFDASGVGHRFQSQHRLKSPQQDASAVSFGLTRDVGAEVHAVDEIDVGVSGRTEEHGVTRRASDVSVRRRIDGAEIGFVLDDAAGKKFAALAADEELAEKVSRATVIGVAIEEIAGQPRSCLCRSR